MHSTIIILSSLKVHYRTCTMFQCRMLYDLYVYIYPEFFFFFFFFSFFFVLKVRVHFMMMYCHLDSDIYCLYCKSSYKNQWL